jgi:peptidoglycan hydrolase-like protein with peptidoglycan-binding domain
VGDEVEKQVTFRDMLGKVSTSSHFFWEIVLNKINVHILEMEDVLFHHDSGVMMPENPAGKSSENGASATDPRVKSMQTKVTGIKALALVFKELEFDPNKRMIIAGHADTSGDFKYNFELTGLRAQNVMDLLIGDREAWADICHKKHKIEDYQQIMGHYASKFGWTCDPGKIDNAWGPKTEAAVKNFIDSYNAAAGPVPAEPPLSPDLLGKVKNDGAKRWPPELWRAVFDLYSEELAEALTTSTASLQELRESLVEPETDKFLYPEKRFIACGESFPIDQAQRDKYRSQANRRVEIIFFDKDEALALEDFNCPPELTRAHKAEECPMWNNWHFLPLYIDPDDLYAVVYHLSFRYYDRVARKIRDIPAGLMIKAFEHRKDGSIKDLPVTISYKDGVYNVKVYYKPLLKDPDREWIHFEFKTENQWVHTASDTSDSTIVPLTPEQVAELKKPANYLEWVKYYDLPSFWSSRNYWTRYDGSTTTGDRFEEVFINNNFKPFGEAVTEQTKPLVFCLDDIVLLDSPTGSQDIKDCDHMTDGTHTTAPNPIALSGISRVKIFIADETTGFLKLYQRDDADPKSSRVPFARNLISEDFEKAKTARLVFFRDGFYTIGKRRTPPEANWENKHFVVGARAAIRNDAEYHRFWDMTVSSRDKQFHYCGDFDLHYFHRLHLENKHPVSYVIYYLSVSFMRDTRDPTKVPPIPSQADVKKFNDEGVYNAMERYNKKPRFFDVKTASETTDWIKPFYFFDERETFVVPNAEHPGPVDFEDETKLDGLFATAGITKARRNALGGKSKFLAFIAGDDPNVTPGTAWHWAVRPNHHLYSVFNLYKSSVSDQGGQYTGQPPKTEFGETFGVFTFAHELGHGTGLPDEYIYAKFKSWPEKTRTFCDYVQGFDQYTMSSNYASIMYHNKAPRLHNLWYALHMINSQADVATAPGGLNDLLNGKKFVVKFVHPLATLTYGRDFAATPARNRDVRVPMCLEEQYALTEDKHLSLALYDVGQDESSSRDGFHAGQNNFEYQAVLLVRLLLRVNFDNDSSWHVNNRINQLAKVEDGWKDLSEKYRLVGGAKSVKNIFIHFLPGFTAASNPLNNYTVDFLQTNATGGDPKIYFGWWGHLQVVFNVMEAELIRFFLNMNLGDNNFLAGLDFLRTWANGKLSDTFQLQPI